jgi:hypothetical protein
MATGLHTWLPFTTGADSYWPRPAASICIHRRKTTFRLKDFLFFGRCSIFVLQLNIFSVKPLHQRLVIYCCIFLFLSALHARGQAPRFAPLGATQYAGKVAELKKFKPGQYADAKDAQAWYKELMETRNKALLEEFEQNHLVHDSLLLDKCNQLFARIKKANAKYKFDSITLYLNRSLVANAVCYGEGTIMLNLGLLLWVDNDDELAFVIAHELSHQLLRHNALQMEKTVNLLTSNDFKDELKSIKKADYNKYSRFRELMKGVKVENGIHSRFKESEADSLGTVLILNAGFNKLAAAKMLLKLDHAEELFTAKGLYDVPAAFANTGLEGTYFQPQKKYNGLSMANVTMNADVDIDTLKTHPDCKQRFVKIVPGNADTVVQCCKKINNTLPQVKERALQELLRYYFEKNSLTSCIHLCLLAKQYGYNAATIDFFLTASFARLCRNDVELERFSSVHVGAKAGSDLKLLQDFLLEMSLKDLQTVTVFFLNRNVAKGTEAHAFASLLHDCVVKQAAPEPRMETFAKTYPGSQYQYLLTKIFIKTKSK